MNYRSKIFVIILFAIVIIIGVPSLIYVSTKPSPKTNDTLTADDLLAMTDVDLFRYTQTSTPEENKAMEKNTSPEKYERLNDKIMNMFISINTII